MRKGSGVGTAIRMSFCEASYMKFVHVRIFLTSLPFCVIFVLCPAEKFDYYMEGQNFLIY